MKKGQMGLFETTADRPHLAMVIADTDQSSRSLELLVQLIDEPQKFRKLRQAVRDFAGRGRLVAQYETEGTGTALLQHLQADLELAGGQWKQPDASQIGSDLGYSIPSSWTFIRLENLLTFGPRNGYSPKSVSYPTATKTLTLTATTSGRFNGEHCKYVDEAIPPDSFLWLEDGDLLIQRANTIEYVGSPAVFRGQRGSFIYPDLMMKVRLSKSVSVDFIHLMLLTSPARSFLRSRASGTAGSMPKINQTDVRSIPIPLPPLAEQERIVAKVDELMALCDELEARQTRKRDTGDRLTKAALGALTSADGPGELRIAWQRVATNFGELLNDPSKLHDLRRVLRDLAGRGLLVPQNGREGTGHELTASLRLDIESAGGQWKAPEQDRIATDAGRSIPGSWTWIRLENALTWGPKNGFSPKSVDYPTSTKTLTLTATTSGRFNGDHYKYVDETIPDDSSLWLEDGDILIQRANTIEYVGASAVYRGARGQFIYPDLMMKVRVSKAVDVDFVHLMLSTPASRSFLRARASGTAGSMPKVNQTDVKTIPIALPPLAEQRRIVARMVQLLALCDDLEAKLRARDEKAARLAAALVAEAIA